MALNLNELMEGVVTGMLGGFEATRRTRLRQSVAAGRELSSALRRERPQLEAALGPDHPALLELDEAIAEADQLQAIEESVLRRSERAVRPKPDEWLIAGQVSRPNGDPVAGVPVSFSDPQNRYAEQLGSVTSDEGGRFSKLFSARQHRDLFAARPEVLATVRDAAGRARSRSESTARLQPGGVAVFDLLLGNPPGIFRTR